MKGPSDTVEEGQHEFCGICEVEIDRDRMIDFTLKNRKRVCEQCFVRETPRPALYQAKRWPWQQEMANRLVGEPLATTKGRTKTKKFHIAASALVAVVVAAPTSARF